MRDIYGGLALTVAMASASFLLVWWATRNASRGTCRLLALSVVGLMILYIVYVWDQVWLAQWLPVSNLIVVGNLFPVLSAVLGALVCRHTAGEPWRRGFDLAALFSASFFSAVAPLLGSAPQCGDVWVDQRLCQQTTDRTCTPACAATLLRSYGIAANEQEMARLCFTRKGTTWQGLYHGLKAKTASTRWDVAVSQGKISDLRQLNGAPVILRVGMDKNHSLARDLELEMGWRPGVGHSVVLLRFVNDHMVEIADPTPGIGVEYWSINELRTLWGGQMVRLVDRRQ